MNNINCLCRVFAVPTINSTYSVRCLHLMKYLLVWCELHTDERECCSIKVMYCHNELNTLINTMTISTNEQNYNKQYNESATHLRCCRIVTVSVSSSPHNPTRKTITDTDIDDGTNRWTNMRHSGQTPDFGRDYGLSISLRGQLLTPVTLVSTTTPLPH